MGRKGRLRRLKKVQKTRIVTLRGADAEDAFEAFCNLTENDFNEDGSLKAGVYFLPSSAIPLIKYHQ